LRSRPETAALADEAAAVRADLRKKREAWEDAVDESRAATAEVVFRDANLDAEVKGGLKAGLGVMTASMPQKRREALTAKLFGGKPPAEGMKPVGGPIQAHYVDAILAHLATPDFAPLADHAGKITVLRTALSTAETTRMERRTAEQLARTALEDATEAAKRFYNQMAARLELLFPDDPAFVESCFLDLRNAAPDQGAEARRRALLVLYRARFGAVPRELSAALDDELDDAKFAKYVELFATKGAGDIAGEIIPKKG
jgi:hypothetical protein